ncbi:MAG: hypothetical protein ACRD50_16855, partial [Candidatus Acidiferrales bacterium]
MADADLKSELRGTPTGELGSRLQRLSLRESSLKRFFSNFRDFLVERPVKLRGSDGPAPFVDEQFGGGFWDNLRESFRSVPRSAQNVHSGLLVEWKPGLGVFIQNLRDSLFPRKLPPLNVTSKPIAVPEIWSKNEQFKSVQALSIAVHAVVAALIIVPIWRGIMTPPTTQASNVVITTISDYSPTLAKLPPGKDKAGGGGGGGERNPVPASKGRAPKFSWTQIAPPSARTPDHAQILVQPNLLGPPDLKLQNNNMPNWGDPFAKSVTTSNGPGSGG